MGDHVLSADSPPPARARDGTDIQPQFPRHASRGRSCRCETVIEPGRNRCSAYRGMSLRFPDAVRTTRPHRVGWCFMGFDDLPGGVLRRGRLALDVRHPAADPHLGTHDGNQFPDPTVNGRGDFHGHLVDLQFEQGLAGGDPVPRGNQDSNDHARFDAFPQIRQALGLYHGLIPPTGRASPDRWQNA